VEVLERVEWGGFFAFPIHFMTRLRIYCDQTPPTHSMGELDTAIGYSCRADWPSGIRCLKEEYKWGGGFPGGVRP